MSKHATGARRHRAAEGAVEGISPNEAQGMSEMVVRGHGEIWTNIVHMALSSSPPGDVTSVDVTEINSSQ